MPPYTVARKRKDYTTYYFVVPEHLRPAGWLATIPLGNDRADGLKAVSDAGWQKYNLLQQERRSDQLGEYRRPSIGTFPDVIDKYKDSEDWASLSPATKKGYNNNIEEILIWSKAAGHPALKNFTAAHFYAYLSKRYKDKPRQQQYMKSVLSVLMGFAVRLGYVDRNIVKEVRLSRRSQAKSKYKIIPWTESDVQAFMDKADAMGWSSIGTAVLIAFETGQRQTDVLRMQQPRDYENGVFRFRQSKTGKGVSIPATGWLQSRLNKIPREQFVLCQCDSTKKTWEPVHFCHRFREVAKAAGLDDHLFKQLRHSHLIMMERAGCDDQEINSHSGHSRVSGKAMRDKAYGLDRDAETAKRAVEKLENFRKKSELKSS
jgi:integrase